MSGDVGLVDAGACRLYTATRNAITVPELLADLSDHRLFGYAMTVSSVPWVVAAQGSLESDGTHIALNTVFEIQLFPASSDCDFDVLWVNRAQGSGDARILSKDPVSLVGWESETVDCETHLTGGQFLLWGKSTGHDATSPGWALFSEDRLGSFPVPFQGVAPGGYLSLPFIEYVVPTDGGNLAVAYSQLGMVEIHEPAPEAEAKGSDQ